MTTDSEQSDGARARRSSRKRVVLIVVVVLLALVASVAVVAAFGLVRLPGSADSARPPCEKLPTVREVESALATHSDLIERIEEVGDGVDVSVSKPCDAPERALVRVTFTSERERAGVDAILREEGFGTPVELVSG